MKRIFFIISSLIVLGVVYLLIMNINNYTSINYIYSNLLDAQTHSGITEQGGFYNFAMRTSTLIFLTLFSGLFVGAGTVYMFLVAQNDKVKAYQRELEKTSISGTNHASRVEVLEAKIKTLEKAFNTVIDERTKLEVQIKNLNSEIDTLKRD